MKNLIYFFLFFSTVVFSQNYNYAVEDPKKTTLPVVNNQLEEIEYFNAYLLPITKKATLQSALDTYGSVRLEKGDYSGVNIVMRSNQKLYGHPTLTKVSNITIEAGSSGVHLEDLFPANSFITFQSGGIISGCTFKSIKWGILKGSNIMLENCSFINYSAPIQLDCSQSGYLRNNKIIRHQSGTVSNLLVMKGNSTTPSYGNVHLWTNYLTPHGDTTELDNLQSANFVGLDAEAWNLKGLGTKAMFFAKNMGNVKITDFNGGNGGSPYKTPSFDIDSNNILFLNRRLADPTDILSVRTNMLGINGNGTYTRSIGPVTGTDLLGNFNYSNAVTYNSIEQTATLTNTTIINNLRNTILGTRGTPWARPEWETLPDPLGANWKTERLGKPDQTSYIQGLINANKIAELPEGVFYISSTLKIPADSYHGIVGKGTGKTVIVGLTDDFPIISLMSKADGSIQLAHLTIQGGSVGVYASTDYGALNIAYQNMKFVIFRNQNYGIYLKRTGGFDNNFLDNLSFIDCNIGFYKEPTPGNSGEDNSAYVDKTMFYKNQFLNCKTAISLMATRADNLNAWVDCKFDRGTTAFDLGGQNAPIIANCDFTNFSGEHVISSNTISIYNSRFLKNSVLSATIKSTITNMEGCTLMDNTNVFAPVLYNTINSHIVNSTITGNAVAVIPPNKGFGKASLMIVNSSLLANPTISKLLANVKLGVPIVIIDSAPIPYPQLLVTQ
jgi:hypothetical protein